MSSLSNEIKKNIKNRVILCVLILALAHIISISFYIYFFTEQTRDQLNNISKELTPYIISQEIIGNRYAINLKISEIEKSNNIRINWIKQNTGHKSKKFFSNPLIWKFTVPLVGIDKKYYGYYEISGYLTNDPWIALGLFIQFLFLIIFLIIIRFILYPVANDIPKKIFVDPISKLIYLLEKNNPDEINSFMAPAEIILLRDRFIELISKQNEILKKTEILKISQQVAHDIRSPLAAINTVLSDVTTIQESKRIIIRNAAKRINDIANNLLFQNRDTSSGSNLDNAVSPELMFVVLDNIVSEKRFEYQKSETNIQLEIEKSSYNCFSDINLASFKRVLSNLINNSIEALKTKGSVVISLKSHAGNIEIGIKDNGCGIPPDILPEVLQQGFSFNKKNGAGLGLSYANKYIEQLGGKLTIHSEVNIGTKITISLIRSNPPFWFCESLNIDSNLMITVLDDDISIHDAWNNRFSNISCKKLMHFYKASDLLNRNSKIANQTGLYLVDYELLADKKNGLDVIEQLNLSKKSILVTSCFEDKDVRNRSKELGVKILPKAYVPYVPIIELKNSAMRKKIIFIDNDDLMRDTWVFSAKAAGVCLSVYSSFDEFIQCINHHEKNSIIYIDSELGTQIKGETYAKELFDKGYTEIHLSTGHSPDKMGNIPWVKSIVGKEPPFLSKKI